MEDEDEYLSSEEEVSYCSDKDSFDGIDTQDPQIAKKTSCKVITRGSLLTAQRDDLHRVMDLLSLKEHHARTLLIHHRWDVNKLIAFYVEKGKACLFAEAGVTEAENQVNTLSSSAIMCDICMEDVPNDAVSTMDCGHCFCNGCWTEHFLVKINEGQSRRIRCMAHKCNAICDEAVVRCLVSKRHPDLAEKFDRFLLESYIEDNKMVKWCPSVPHCGNAIRIDDDDDEFCEVECSCGMQFCFSCLAEVHSPCSCSMWDLWTKRYREESANVNWISVNTKPCPNCQKLVQKNGGCNLVKCICGQAFCWLCGGATGTAHNYSYIIGHSCGRYKEDKEKKSQPAKRDLYRYIHYHNRYKAHTDSLKLENKLKNSIQKKVSTSEEKKSTVRDFSWVMNGFCRLFRSRRVLACSYPFAFYMFGDLFKDEMTKKDKEIKQYLFENQQQQLEENIEKLSKFLEEQFDEFSEAQLLETRMHVINLSVLIDSLCKKMYECIENDLFGSFQHGIHSIAPYSSNGIEKAAEISACTGASSADTHLPSTHSINGCGSSDDTGCSRPSKGEPNVDLNLPVSYLSKKRARSRGSSVDLNVRAT